MKTYCKLFLYTFLFFCTIVFNTDNLFAQTINSDGTRETFKLSFSERIRLETFDNTITLSRAAKAGNSYIRFKTSVMGQWFPTESLEFAVKLTNEFRNYFAPTTNTFHANEIFFDQLYLKINTKEVLDGVLTIGRQNISFGEGFIVMEGNPLDGSRSTYFNAVKYDWNINKNHSLSVWGSYMNKDDQLPVINGNDIDAAFIGDGTWRLTEQKEAGGGLYYTGKMTDVNLQAYYIRKDYLDPDSTLGQVESDVNTLGSRICLSLNKNISSTIEAAYQTGNYGDYNTNAFGGYAYVDFMPLFEQWFLPNTITIGTIYLSGDDPNTNDNEGWDPVYSRWPKWSDSYIYTQIKENNGKVAYWSNMLSIYASLKFNLDEKTKFNFDYHHMTAPQTGCVSSITGSSGNIRGDLFIAKIVYEANKNFSGHFQFEHFIPGNYYFSGANVSNWARFEITYKI
jgi:hypothetical protein